MVSIINSAYGKKLNELRRSKNVKQLVLAEELKMDQAHYSNLENGKVLFTEGLIKQICKYFNLLPEEFKDASMAILTDEVTKVTGKKFEDKDASIAFKVVYLELKKQLAEAEKDLLNLKNKLDRYERASSEAKLKGTKGIYVMM